MRKFIRPSLAMAISGLLSLFASIPAWGETEAPNWCQEAERSLTDRQGNAITCNAIGKRCVRMNNYWCQKHSASPWRGTPKSDGKDGNRDSNGHAVFESVEWSARAIGVDLRAKYKRGLVSAVSIAAAHSPWCDTLGSKAIKDGHGRTCKDGGEKPPAGFSGPYCQEPKTAKPTVSECAKGCNCPPEIAEVLIKGLDTDINADLKLFDAAGNPQAPLLKVIQNLAIQEQGIYVKQKVIEDGLARMPK